MKVTRSLLSFILLLLVTLQLSACPKYNRKDDCHWIDEDRDCQNTRNEVLIQESLELAICKSSKGCRVSSRKWYGSFTGKSFTNSGEGENGENSYKEGLEHGRLSAGNEEVNTPKHHFHLFIPTLKSIIHPV